MTPKVALTIAGSDASGGAGIQADLKTFSAFGVYGTTAITAITAQNTVGVQQVFQLDNEIIRNQIVSITDDFDVRSVKTGMLGTAMVVDLIRDLASNGLFQKLVVDPVMVSTSGARLLAENARDSYRLLLPFVDLITPNLFETEYLLQTTVADLQDMKLAARRLCELGARSALVKGGHLEGGAATDVYFDGEKELVFTRPKIESQNLHGTGCTLSAAIAAGLARDEGLIRAIEHAKRYVSTCIESAASWRLGAGSGPIDHFTVIAADGV